MAANRTAPAAPLDIASARGLVWGTLGKHRTPYCAVLAQCQPQSPLHPLTLPHWTGPTYPPPLDHGFTEHHSPTVPQQSSPHTSLSHVCWFTSTGAQRGNLSHELQDCILTRLNQMLAARPDACRTDAFKTRCSRDHARFLKHARPDRMLAGPGARCLQDQVTGGLQDQRCSEDQIPDSRPDACYAQIHVGPDVQRTRRSVMLVGLQMLAACCLQDQGTGC